MLERMLKTDHDFVLAVSRLVLGVVFFAHGAGKMLGWFGGAGFRGTMGLFTEQMHIPAPLAFLAIAAEFFGGLGLILGFLGRIAAFGVAVDMIVAAVMVHLRFGFFMNWFGNQKGEGVEYHLLAIVLAVAVMMRGSGAFSADRALARRFAVPSLPVRESCSPIDPEPSPRGERAFPEQSEGVARSAG